MVEDSTRIRLESVPTTRQMDILPILDSSLSADLDLRFGREPRELIGGDWVSLLLLQTQNSP